MTDGAPRFRRPRALGSCRLRTGAARSAGGRLASARWRRAGERESGQAMALVLLVLLVVSIVPTLIVSQLSSQLPLLSSSVNNQAALAAAEAGAQNYINLLDSYTNYWCYTSNLTTACNGHGLGESSEPPQNAALPGSCNENNSSYSCATAEGQCGPGWEQVPGGRSPSECFAYTPVISQLENTTGATASQPLPGSIVLVVVGRAGTGSSLDYRRISVGLALNGPISFLYYSNKEQPGTADIWNWENTYSNATAAYGATCVSVSCYGGSQQSSNLDEVNTTVSYPNPNGPGQITEPLVQALCGYHTDDINTYVDWYSQNVAPILTQSPYYNSSSAYGYQNSSYGSGTAFGPQHPLYGPFYGNFPDPADPGYMFEPACQGNYYIAGTVFRGSIYTNDQLTTCGTGGSGGLPGNDVWFQGKYETAVPQNFPFPKNWPGTDTGGSGAPYPDLRNTGPFSCSNQPEFDGGSVWSADVPLPPFNNSLASFVQPNDPNSQGCLYTGPTMIRFYWDPSSSSEEMYVWSPLTRDTSPGCGYTGPPVAGTECSTAGSVTGTNFCNEISADASTANTTMDAVSPSSTGNLIYVQSPPSSSTDPNCWNATGCPTVPSGPPASAVPGAGNYTANPSYNVVPAAMSSCLDPWEPPGEPTSPSTCDEGDVMVSGTAGATLTTNPGGVSGWTIAADASIVLSGSVTLACSLGNQSPPEPSFFISGSTAPNCAKSPDMVGLVANQNVWLSHPTTGGETSCPHADAADDPSLVSYPAASSSTAWDTVFPWCAATGPPDPNNSNCTPVVTSNCPGNPVIDAAFAALQGFFEVQNFNSGDASGGNMYINGSDIVNNAGQYGSFNPSGDVIVTGYIPYLSYDARLKYEEPPQFTQATKSSWQESAYISCVNATDETNDGNCTPLH